MREPRLIIPHVPHHFVIRGNNRRRIFSYDYERLFFLKLVEEALAKHDCRLHAINLLDNHVHLMATPPSKEAASSFVHSFAQRYAQLRNRLRGGTGKLFEREFGAYAMCSDGLLAQKLAYVDFNGVHHRVYERPEEERWSTYGLHIGRPELTKIPPRIWTPCDWYLGFGAERYRSWVDECIALDAKEERPPRDFRLRRPNQTRAT